MVAWLCGLCCLFVDHESAAFSDLGRLLSCWKHTAAHPIFTAPSDSRLQGLPWTGPAAADRQRGEEAHQQPSPRHKHPRRPTALWLKVRTQLLHDETWPTILKKGTWDLLLKWKINIFNMIQAADYFSTSVHFCISYLIFFHKLRLNSMMDSCSLLLFITCWPIFAQCQEVAICYFNLCL